MSWALFFLVLGLILLKGDKDFLCTENASEFDQLVTLRYGDCFFAQISASTASSGQASVAFARQRCAQTGFAEPVARLESAQKTSFQRSQFSTQGSSSNGSSKKCAVEVRGLSTHGQGLRHVLPWMQSMVGELHRLLISGDNFDICTKTSRLCQRFMGGVARLGTPGLSEPKTSPTAPKIASWQRRSWRQRRWERQRWEERIPKRLHGARRNGTSASATYPALHEHHGYSLDATAPTLQRWQSFGGSGHCPAGRIEIAAGDGHSQEERDRATPRCGAGAQGHVGEGWQDEDQGDARGSRSFGEAHAALEHACHERAQNLATWRQFLHQSVQRWQEYTERFQHQERVNLGAIGQAREELKQAQNVFKELQDKGIIAIDAEDDPATMDSEMVKE